MAPRAACFGRALQSKQKPLPGRLARANAPAEVSIVVLVSRILLGSMSLGRTPSNTSIAALLCSCLSAIEDLKTYDSTPEYRKTIVVQDTGAPATYD